MVAGLEPLAEVVAGQDAGHHVASAQAERQAEAQGQAAEGDQDQVVQQGELDAQLVEGRDEGQQGQHVVAAVGQVLGVGDAHAVGAGGDHAPQEAGDQQADHDHHRGHQQVGNVVDQRCPWPTESFSRPRMLKAAMTNTHISSQKTIVPTIAGTLRLMPMCCIDSARPLRSAAVCRPIFSLSLVIALATSRATM